MITGSVKSDEARIRLKVKGRKGREQEIVAIIDSGFTGALTLPPALITTLDLHWQSVDEATLGDGSKCVFKVYVGKLLWDGQVRTILIAEADADPLVGMRLLKGHELKIQVRSRGKVTIKRLPRKQTRGGIDHTRLTFRYQGRDFRLTDVHGNVVREIVG